MEVVRARDGAVVLKVCKVADNAWLRMKGLLGRHQLPAEEGLWIQSCNSVHTFFMTLRIVTGKQIGRAHV